MAVKKKTRRLIIQAVDPERGTQTAGIQISYSRIKALGRRSKGQIKECAYIVPRILQRPTAIFEGLRSDNDKDRRGFGWRCYVGLPSCCYRRDGEQTEPPKGMVFMVFVNDDGITYNWRWEPANDADPKLPVDHESRFAKRWI